MSSIYEYNNIENLYIVPDIHGDLDALIISLRDCAKVIESSNKLDLNSWKERTDPLFGFTWTGNNTYILFIGDLLDNSRDIDPRYPSANDYWHQDIPNEEIKIVIFLSKLNELAEKVGGKVLKIIGNHEYNNICNIGKIDEDDRQLPISDPTYKYIFNKNEMYDGIKRTDLFLSGSKYNYLLNITGKNAGLEAKKAVIVKINDFLFVHGGINQYIIEELEKNIKNNEYNLIEVIEFINNNFNDVCDKINNYIISEEDGLLVTRFFNNLKHIKNKDLCDDLIHTLSELNRIISDVNVHLKLVTGHTPQTIDNVKDTNTSNSVIKLDKNLHIISQPIKPFNERKVKTSKGEPKDFGISIHCPDKTGLGQLYNIDCGISRVFDGVEINGLVADINKEDIDKITADKIIKYKDQFKKTL
jgi:hypothetical protein